MRLTGSSLDRASKCTGSAVLAYAKEDGGPSAARGIVVHKFLENVRNLGLEDALDKAPDDYREMLENIDLNRLPLDPAAYNAEVAYAYNAKTGKARLLGVGLERKYDLLENEIPCTLDVVGVFDDYARVGDYKTGWTDYGSTKEIWQLRFGALCVSAVHRVDRVLVSIIRIREDGTPWEDFAEFDAMELDQIAFEVSELQDKVNAAQLAAQDDIDLVPLKTGNHCKYCPSYAYCPAKTKLITALAVRTTDEVRTDLIQADILTAEVATLAFARLLAYEEVLKRVRRSLEEFAFRTPIQLEDGRVFGLKELSQEQIDPVKGVAILADKYGANFATDCVETKTTLTKAALERALRKWMQRNQGHKIGKLKSSSEELLREGGAVRVRTTRSVSLHTPKQLSEGSAADGQEERGEVEGAVNEGDAASGQAD